MGARGPKRDTGRELAMCELYRAGKTLAEIGSLYGMTRERVRQLIARHGMNRNSGGATLGAIQHAKVRELRRRDRLEAKYQKWFGCSRDQALTINGGKEWSWACRYDGSVCAAYMQQRQNALSRRAIEWKFTLPDWWAVWEESGKWDQRGRGQGYCMARHGDTGPYERANVYICTIGQNFSDSYLVHPWKERFPNHKAQRDELGLSQREREAYDLRKRGHTRAEIAAAMGMSVGALSWMMGVISKIAPLPPSNNKRRFRHEKILHETAPTTHYYDCAAGSN